MSFKLIILQTDPLEAKNTARRFEKLGCTIAAIDTDGKKAVSLAKEHHPDALLLDPYLIGRNCDEIASEILEEYDLPLATILISRSPNSRIGDRFLESGGDFYLLAPVDYPYTLKRIRLTLEKKRKADGSSQSPIRRCVKKYQVLMAMRPRVKGYDYLQDAVELVLENPEYLHHLTDGLYPAIGLRHQSNGSSVERCIRTLLERTFEEGNIDYLYAHFGHIVREDTGKPRPGDFIKELSAMIRADLL